MGNVSQGSTGSSCWFQNETEKIHSFSHSCCKGLLHWKHCPSLMRVEPGETVSFYEEILIQGECWPQKDAPIVRWDLALKQRFRLKRSWSKRRKTERGRQWVSMCLRVCACLGSRMRACVHACMRIYVGVCLRERKGERDGERERGEKEQSTPPWQL